MMNRWLSVVFLALGLGVGTAKGQQLNPYMPTPVGASRIPEPFPVSGSTPPMMAGPLNSYTLPPAPDETINLPAGHSSAFQSEQFVREEACFFHLGAVALTRQGLNSQTMAVFDPVGRDTGILPPANAPVIASLNQVPVNTQWGVAGTLGYLWDTYALEVTGEYMIPQTKSATITNPGRLDGFFVNPPAGFNGNRGLWLQADQMSFQFKDTLGSAEVNYRYTSPAVTEAELILGLRYVNYQEQLNVFTSDDSFPVFNPTNAATYQVQTNNQFVGTQIGVEWEYLIYKCLFVGVMAKSALGADFSNSRKSLVRGDGLLSFNAQTNSTNYLSQVYDADAFVEFHLTEKCVFRATYDFMWLVGVKLGQEQLDFNLANPQGQNRNGNVYFSGPRLEMRFLF